MIATYGSLGTAVDAYSGERVAQLRAPTYAQLIDSAEVATRAAHALGDRFTPELIRASLDAQISAAMPMLVVSVTAPSADDAVRILATVEQVFKQYVAQLEQPGRDGSLTGVNLTSDPPAVSRVGNPLSTALLAGLAGFIAGTLLALYRDRTDEVIRNAGQIARAGLPYRGTVESREGLLQAGDATFRRIALGCTADGRGSGAVLVTGLDAASDSVVGRLAGGFGAALAAYGRTVTAVWARPDGEHRAVAGFTDVLAGEASWGDCAEAGAVNNLTHVGLGTKADGIDTLIMRRTLGEAGAVFDTRSEHTVVAGPPLLVSPTAITLAAQANSCLLVVTFRHTLLPDLHDAVYLLQGMGIPVIGIVAVHARNALFRAGAQAGRSVGSSGPLAEAAPAKVEVAVQ